ncbi:MAG: bifunctional 5,10-methylenetetrahydrofolate dehydrogenase/5,10-methenyltetrahydrofolate cyclohydrolase [Candidatus Cloacimonetes bacterium]|nr:bifunctional 5,10-methylenetetrahydrofolate dehydrogenase/5,10-methenyltetrahydrofolate cyclohydrolase [Candidatus Cloacimonadota bacterium]
MENILSGKKVAQKILNRLKLEVTNLKNRNVLPSLNIFMVGKEPASEYYSQNIIKKSKKADIIVNLINLSEDVIEEELITQIEKANLDKDVHGILLQLPLPIHIRADKVIMSINPNKDVDGLHPFNAGKLLLGKDSFIPCTPLAVLELIKFYEIKTDGAKVVILGRSNIVGKPLANLLLQKKMYGNATVTVCHSHTNELKEITKSADILIAAIGKPEFVSEKMVNSDAIIIDVGINKIFDENCERYKFVGDVDYENVREKVKAITPVPGGIGSITTTTLLSNVIKAATFFSIK